MPDGAAAVAGADGMGPNGDKGYRAIPGSRGLGCSVGRDVADRRPRPGRAVPVEDGTDLMPLALVAADREWDVAEKVGFVARSVRRLVSVEATGRVVGSRAEMSGRGPGAGDREPT